MLRYWFVRNHISATFGNKHEVRSSSFQERRKNARCCYFTCKLSKRNVKLISTCETVIRDKSVWLMHIYKGDYSLDCDDASYINKVSASSSS